MKTLKQTIEYKDYWYDNTLDRYVPNARQTLESATELIKGDGEFSFISNMVVLFNSPMNHPKTFCKIESKAVLEFTSSNLLGETTAAESIWLMIKQQYQFCINIFRQHQFGTLALPTHINQKLIDQEVYQKFKEQYEKVLYFWEDPQNLPVISDGADFYSW